MADSPTRQIPLGPEPEYERIVSGYETFHWPHEFACEWGGTLPEITLAYESWGELSVMFATQNGRVRPRRPTVRGSSFPLMRVR